MGNLTRTMAVAVLGTAAAWGPPANAQNGVLTPPISNWTYQNHASTAAEGFLQGQAAVVTSVGQANYLNSVAAVNFQEAVRRNIENHGLYVRTRIENRELNRQYRERYEAPQMTQERWQRIIAASLPERLTAEQFDSATGRLIWPHILRGDEYKAFRDPIDELLSSRTPETSGDGSPNQRELDQLVKGMMALLKSNIDTVSASQYGSAKWFLMSIAYEAKQATSHDPQPADGQPIVIADGGTAAAAGGSAPADVPVDSPIQPNTIDTNPVEEISPTPPTPTPIGAKADSESAVKIN
jgi:hypothetical protein